MTTIYLVTDGNYSDYRIVSAHSTRELAERAKELANADGIEEWDLDPELPQTPPGRLPWCVTMNRDGSTAHNRREAVENFTPSIGFASVNHGDTPPGIWRLHIRCWARDEAHAVKIANEHRAALVAADLWPSVTVAKWTHCDLSEAAQAVIAALEPTDQ